MAEAIYRKYRPMTFQDVTDQNHVKITIQNQISSGTLAHAYLFAGPRGVGKTTIARLLAKTVNCENRKEDENEPCNTCSNCEEMNIGKSLDIVEIDAASHTGVDNVRENIIESVRFAPSKGKYKVFIIDEVHMLSTSAFNALLKTLEEPPAHGLFVLATTEIHKIPQTILSRCQRFDFHRIAAEDMAKRLHEIAKSEGVTVEEDVMSQIVRLSEGCLRDAESLFGQVLALGEKNIGKDEASIILPVTNTAVVVDVVGSVVKKDLRTGFERLNAFVDQGGSVKNLVDEMIDFVRSMLMLSIGGLQHDHYDAKTTERMKEFNEQSGTERIKDMLDALLDVRNRPSSDVLPHLPLEIAMVELCSGAASVPQTTDDTDVLGKAEAGGVALDAQKTPEEPKASPSPMPSEQVKEAPVKVEASDVVAENAEVASSPGTLDIQELKDKWGRCCDAVSKRSVALPLALQKIEIMKCEGEEVTIGFEMKFHYDTMSQPKNLKILADAIQEVMQVSVRIVPQYLKEDEEKTLDTLVEAFGGAVME